MHRGAVFGPLAKSLQGLLCAWVWLAAQSIPAGVRAITAFAPKSAGGWPGIADCLEIRTGFLLRTPAPKPCGTLRIAADCKGAVADCKRNKEKIESGIPDCRCSAPIVLCIFMYMWIAHAALAGYSAHAGRARGGGGQHTCCDKAQHHSRKFYHPTPLSKIVALGALGSNLFAGVAISLFKTPALKSAGAVPHSQLCGRAACTGAAASGCTTCRISRRMWTAAAMWQTKGCGL